MILRTPPENENERISLHVVVPATRHSRARGNPGLFSAELTWIPAGVYPERSRRAGMTERSWSVDGAKRNPGSSFYRSSPHRYFQRGAQRSQSKKIFAFGEMTIFYGNFACYSKVCAAGVNFSTRQIPAGGFQTRPYESQIFFRPLRSRSP